MSNPKLGNLACGVCGADMALNPFHACPSQEKIVLDVAFEDHGSIWLARPYTPAADDWIAEHIPGDAQFLGGALVIEPRYVPDIVQGMQGDGLTVVGP